MLLCRPLERTRFVYSNAAVLHTKSAYVAAMLLQRHEPRLRIGEAKRDDAEGGNTSGQQ